MIDPDIPMISYWMGEPLSSIPREVLEIEFVNAHLRIRELERDLCDRSIAHIRDLARMARR